MNARNRRSCLGCFLCCVTILAAGCGEKGGGRARPPQGEAHAADTASSDSIVALIRALGEMEGTFVMAGPSESWQFTGDRAILTAIVESGETAIEPLVDCLGDVKLTRVTVNSRPVPLGVMCYEALQLTVSYEHTGPDGGLDLNWPGYLKPTARAEDLLRAKQAWLDIVARKAYQLP